MKTEQKRAALTESRSADRKTMADALVILATQRGWKSETEQLQPTELCVRLEGPRGLRVWIEFDGRSPQRDVHCMPWHISHGGARLSEAFGSAMGASVNPHHRAKCTTFAQGFDALYAAVEEGMIMADNGSAFEEAKP